jgi:hypothetical protein
MPLSVTGTSSKEMRNEQWQMRNDKWLSLAKTKDPTPKTKHKVQSSKPPFCSVSRDCYTAASSK